MLFLTKVTWRHLAALSLNLKLKFGLFIPFLQRKIQGSARLSERLIGAAMDSIITNQHWALMRHWNLLKLYAVIWVSMSCCHVLSFFCLFSCTYVFLFQIDLLPLYNYVPLGNFLTLLLLTFNGQMWLLRPLFKE